MSDVQSAYALNPLQLLFKGSLHIPKAINTGMISFPRTSYNLDITEKYLNDSIDSPSFKTAFCWAEQTCWAVSASYTNCGVWNADQLAIAGPALFKEAGEREISEKLTGIHFVRSYRSNLNNFAAKVKINDTKPVVLETLPTKPLKFFNFSAERLFSKIKTL